MNIGILIPELDGGGAERIAQIVGNYYFERGHNVYYFLMELPYDQVYPVKGEIINTGITSAMGNYLDNTAVLLWKLLKASLIMRRWKLKYRIDVAVSFMEEFNYINILSKGREKVIARVCTILSSRYSRSEPLCNAKMISFFYRRADQVVVMCDYAIEDMNENFRVPRRKLKKIPNPAIRHVCADTEKCWTYGKSTVICVGRLAPVKQQERIIRAFSYVHTQCKEAKLIILGKGPNKKYLESMCKELAIEDSVFFIGFVEDVGFYLKNSKVFAMASQVEGFPNSMVEAMAYGLPVITTDSPGACGEIIGKEKKEGLVSEIRYCKYGILTPDISGKIKKGEGLSEKEIMFGEAMRTILTDKDKYEHYRKQSLKRADMFGMERVMKKWDRLLGLDS